MKNLIAFFSKQNARTVFTDKTYLYDRNHLGHLT